MNCESVKKLKDILKATGHVLAVEDFDDIAELDRLAGKVADPQHGLDSPLSQHPVFFRGVPVYALTLGHLTFLDEAAELLELEADHQTVIMLWAVTKPAITDADYNPATSRKEFHKWTRHCPWSVPEMETILDLRYGSIIRKAKAHDKTDSKHDGSYESALIGLLSREYGESPHYWMWVAPLGMIESCVADWMHRQEQQATAYRTANKGRSPVAPPPSPKFSAMKEFRECAERIEAKWRRKV